MVHTNKLNVYFVYDKYVHINPYVHANTYMHINMDLANSLVVMLVNKSLAYTINRPTMWLSAYMDQ